MTTVGSLFTGYGGLDMGVAMAVDPDARVAWTSDVEKAANPSYPRDSSNG